MSSELLEGEAPVVMKHCNVRLQADREPELLGSFESALLE
jgi:hypothetical protein